MQKPMAREEHRALLSAAMDEMFHAESTDAQMLAELRFQTVNRTPVLVPSDCFCCGGYIDDATYTAGVGYYARCKECGYSNFNGAGQYPSLRKVLWVKFKRWLSTRRTGG